MAQKFTNAARAELIAGINSVDTSFTIAAGGNLFPVANTGAVAISNAADWFKLVIQDVDGIEIVYVRTHVADSASFSNILRGQEGTTAKNFAAGSIVGLRPLASDAANVVRLGDARDTQIQTLLEGKVDSVPGKGLSTEDFTSNEKTKLGAIAPNATANATDASLRDRSTHTGQQAISTVTGLTAELAAKAASTEVAPLSHVGAGGDAHSAASNTVAGFMSAADKAKLDGISAGATNYTHPANHPPSVIEQDANNRFVTDAEKAAWSAKQDSDADLVAIAALSGTSGLLKKTAANTWSLDTTTYSTPSTIETLTNKTLTGYTETVYALAGTDIAVANGTIQTKTLAANTTFTESLADGQSVILGITAGAYSVTWPSVTWAKVGGSGTAPTLTSSGVNWVILWQVGGVVRGSFLGTA